MVFSHHLIQSLQQQVVGQEYAVAALARAVTLALAGRRPDHRPLAVMLFAGPTGSGKTHVAQAFARTLLGNERKLISINCQQLNGDEPSPSSLPEQLLMGEWLARSALPYGPTAFSVIILEEIDKAPQSFRDHVVTAIDRGEIGTLGYRFSLRQTFLILTCRLTRKKTDQIIGRTLGFLSED